MLSIKASGPAGKEEEREEQSLWGHGGRCRAKKQQKKNPDKSRKRELSPQLSVHQEVLSQAAQEVPQKEEEVQSGSRKCFFFFLLLRLHEVWPLKGGRVGGEGKGREGRERRPSCV